MSVWIRKQRLLRVSLEFKVRDQHKGADNCDAEGIKNNARFLVGVVFFINLLKKNCDMNLYSLPAAGASWYVSTTFGQPEAEISSHSSSQNRSKLSRTQWKESVNNNLQS